MGLRPTESRRQSDGRRLQAAADSGNPLTRHGHFIDGAFVPPAAEGWLDSIDPATGAPWARIARGDAGDVDRAVTAAHAAFRSGPWAAMDGPARADRIEALADLLAARWESLVEVEVRDNGKRVVEVRAQFAGLHNWFRPFAEAARRITPRPLAATLPGVACTAHLVPFGVVAAITPWNSPLMIAAWKLAPALAAGNTVVLKPSELASVSSLLFAELAAEVLPPGVLNVVTGEGAEAGAALVAHPLVRKVSFTGSDGGGRAVARAAAAGPWPTTLELGGKSAQVVFADADLDAAVTGVLSGIFLSNGQTCVAGARVIAHEDICDALVERIVAVARSLIPGDPMDPATEIGPLANAAQRDKVLAMIERARAEGAICMTGGAPLHVPERPHGYFIAPTVFTGVTPGMALWREEVFGPVLAVTRSQSEAEAIQLANDSDYGLAAGVWTTDPARGERVAAAIEAGTVYINHYRSVDPAVPIGGMKRSGYGRELGPEAMSDYQQVKSVWQGTGPMADPFPQATERRHR